MVEFSDEERPCGAGAVDLVKDGRRRSGHPGSVARTGSKNEGGLERPLSEFASKKRAEGRSGLEPCRAPLRTPEAHGEAEKAVTRIALLALTGSLIAGCARDGTLGTVGAIVTVPITAPVMFVSARRNGHGDHLERARRNDRPPPPIEGQSREMARATLEEAFERGAIDEGLNWQNDEEASGYAAGGVTVLADREMDGLAGKCSLRAGWSGAPPTSEFGRTAGMAGVGGLPRVSGIEVQFRRGRREVLLTESDDGQRLRSSNPSGGLVSEEERLAIIARHPPASPFVPYDPSNGPSEVIQKIVTEGVDGQGEKALSWRQRNGR